jgi:hypothetical protein
VRRAVLPVVTVAIGLILLADLLVANPALGTVASVALEAAILVAAGAALAGAIALGLQRAWDVARRVDMPGAVATLAGLLAMLVAGLRPGSAGSGDAATTWLVAALLVPLGATLFGVLFVSTLRATHTAVSLGRREATVMALAAMAVLVLLLPVGGPLGDWLASAAGWTLAVPIGGAFRGLLIGIALVGAVVAARTLLGISTPTDE